MRLHRYALTACAAFLPMYSHALDIALAAGYEAEYTDNAALTPDHQTGEWIHTPEATLNLSHDGVSVSATSDYMVSREMYSDNTYGNKTYTEGNAAVYWHALPNRLDFYATNSSTRTTIDSRATPTPNNQQVTNTATTGTTLIIDSFGSQTINLGYDYQWVSADQTNTDSKRQTGTVSYVIPLSEIRSIQLNGSYGDVNYDNPLDDDYKSKSGSLEFVNEGDSFSIDAAVGYTVFDRDLQDEVSGTTGNFDATWHVNEITDLRGSYSRSIQDESINSTAGIPQYGQSFTQDNTNITTPYTLDAYSVGISTQLGHNEVSLDGFVDDQNYDGVQVGQTIQDQKTKGITFGLTRALRPTVTAQLYGNYTTTDYNDTPSRDTYRAGLRVDLNRWRRLSVSFGGGYEKRTSNDPTIEYTEWTGNISLFYTFVGNRRTASQPISHARR